MARDNGHRDAYRHGEADEQPTQEANELAGEQEAVGTGPGESSSVNSTCRDEKGGDASAVGESATASLPLKLELIRVAVGLIYIAALLAVLYDGISAIVRFLKDTLGRTLSGFILGLGHRL